MRLLLFFFLTMCSFALSSQNFKTIKNDELNISIKVLDGWYSEVDGNMLFIKGPIPENIGITKVGAISNPLHETFEATKSALNKIPSCKIYKAKKEEINNNEFFVLEYEMDNQGVRFHDHLYLTVNNGILYSITITSTKQRYKSKFELVYSMFKTLKFLN